MKTILSYLRKLKKNNNRDWFNSNKDEFEIAKVNFENFIQSVITKLEISDPDIKGLDAKKSTFRIYRDIRFTKDKTPYKTNFGSSLQKGGKKSGLAGYYIHIEPGKSFSGGGIWQPGVEAIAKIRQEIDYLPDEFLSIIQNKAFIKIYGGLDTEGFSLVRIPKGYDANHPLAEYLKLNSWLATKYYSDEEIAAPDFHKKISADLKLLKPLFDFINRALD